MAMMAELGLVEGEVRWMGAVELTFWCSEKLAEGTTIDARLDLGDLQRHVDLQVRVATAGKRHRRGYLHAGRWQLKQLRDRKRVEDRVRPLNPDYDPPPELTAPPEDEDETTDLAEHTEGAPSRRRETARIVQQEYDLFEGTIDHEAGPSREGSSSSDGGQRRRQRKLQADLRPQRRDRTRDWAMPGAGRSLAGSAPQIPDEDEETDLTGGASAEVSLESLRTAPPPTAPPPTAPPPGADPAPPPVVSHHPLAHVAPGSPPHIMVPLESAEAVRANVSWENLRLSIEVAPLPELAPGTAVQLLLQLPDLTFHQLSGHVEQHTSQATTLQTDPLDRQQLAPVRVYLG